MDTSVVVVGAGPGGLAMSHHLTGAGVDHVLLERGEVAHSWRTERWDSLRLLTPNWMTALPGHPLRGGRSRRVHDGGRDRGGRWRRTAAPSTRRCTPASRWRRPVAAATGFEVRTADGTWRCDAVVAATGRVERTACARLRHRPPGGRSAAHFAVLPPTGSDRRPRPRAGGGCVRVRSADRGRAAAIGPRCHHRSRRARPVAAFAIEDATSTGGWTGSASSTSDGTRWRTFSVPAVTRRCRWSEATTGETSTSNPCRTSASNSWGASWRSAARQRCAPAALGSLVANADLKEARLLRRIDEWVDEHDVADLVGPAIKPLRRPHPGAHRARLSRFGTVVWATGFRPTYGWLDPRALDRRAGSIHEVASRDAGPLPAGSPVLAAASFEPPRRVGP